MTVHCEGECGVLEQLGERYEFETELTRHGRVAFLPWLPITSLRRVQESFGQRRRHGKRVVAEEAEDGRHRPDKGSSPGLPVEHAGR